MFIFSTPGLIRHLWQLKTIVFMHWYLICSVPLVSCSWVRWFALWSPKRRQYVLQNRSRQRLFTSGFFPFQTSTRWSCPSPTTTGRTWWSRLQTHIFYNCNLQFYIKTGAFYIKNLYKMWTKPTLPFIVAICTLHTQILDNHRYVCNHQTRKKLQL